MKFCDSVATWNHIGGLELLWGHHLWSSKLCLVQLGRWTWTWPSHDVGNWIWTRHCLYQFLLIGQYSVFFAFYLHSLGISPHNMSQCVTRKLSKMRIHTNKEQMDAWRWEQNRYTHLLFVISLGGNKLENDSVSPDSSDFCHFFKVSSPESEEGESSGLALPVFFFSSGFENFKSGFDFFRLKKEWKSEQNR